jgi:site-specific DNA recombinase
MGAIMNNRAVSYARVSSEEQSKGYSLPTQLEACKRYAEDKGYQIVKEFTDAHTGTELERPGLNELYQFIEANKVKYLVVYDIDRLSRAVSHQAIIEMEMAKAGVTIEYVLGGYTDTPEGELMKIIKSGIAQYENRQRTERSRRGKLGKARAGYIVCPAGRAPFGYDYVSEDHKGKFIVNEPQARVVRKIYSWLVDDGYSSYAIAKKLWEEGILSKGDYSDVVYKKFGRGEWSPSTVRRIISNSVYKGDWFYNKTRCKKMNGKSKISKVPESDWIHIKVPAIIDEELWEQAQICLDKNRQRSRRNTKRQYLLRGMVFCPCGRRWTVVYKSHLNRAYYRCPTNEAEHWRKRCAYNFSVRQEILEQTVWETVKNQLLDPSALKDEIDRQREAAHKEAEQKYRRIQEIDDIIAEIDRKLGVLLDELLAGNFSKTIINRRKNELIGERDNLVNEASRLQKEIKAGTFTFEEEDELIKFAEEIRFRLESPTFEQKRRILELIDIRIDVLDRETIKLGGSISDVLVVNLSSAGNWRGR